MNCQIEDFRQRDMERTQGAAGSLNAVKYRGIFLVSTRSRFLTGMKSLPSSE